MPGTNKPIYESPDLSPSEFELFRKLIYQRAGIALSDNKSLLVSSRLARRLRGLSLPTFRDYHRLLQQPDQAAELQTAIDLLTTNETYFFRESRHFDVIADHARNHGRSQGPYRIWSAACSSGEEPYGLAMVLNERLGESGWEIVASDLSATMLARAREARYDIAAARQIPPAYLRRYCLKGTGAFDDTLLIQRHLRSRVSFDQVNLNEALPPLGLFDAILIRNVMIYFDAETKQRVVDRLLSVLRPGGLLIVSHAESLNGITGPLIKVSPSIYQRPGRVEVDYRRRQLP